MRMKKIFKSGKLVKVGSFGVPKFWECGWRRIPCGGKKCVLCGKIRRDRQRHIDNGEDPDDMRSVLEDVGGSLAEALIAIKKDAESKGIDITNIDGIQMPPRPGSFPLYRKVSAWWDSIDALVKEAVATESLWIETEAAADLFWYKDTLAAKTYRQLSNRWHMRQGDSYGEFDHVYTNYVLRECVGILKDSLRQLTLLRTDQKGQLALAAARLAVLEKNIMKI